jgi:hypothetical protein
MKRKLIDFNTFETISNESVLNAEYELQEAADVVARALDIDFLEVNGFTAETVLFETLDDSYVHANYDIQADSITFDNIEELVINEETEKTQAKDLLGKMVDSLLEGQEADAEKLFGDYIELNIVKRSMGENISEATSTKERRAPHRKMGPDGKLHSTGSYFKTRDRGGKPGSNDRRSDRGKPEKSADTTSRKKAKKVNTRKRGTDSFRKAANARKKVAGMKNKPNQFGLTKKMAEVAVVCENVLDYCDYLKVGPALNESAVQHDERGNVVSLRVPTAKARNEGKILKFNWKTLDHEVKTLREEAKLLAQNPNFTRAVSDLKRHNNVSDDSGLQETLENIVSAFPSVIYLTQNELASIVSEALATAEVRNYDDEKCAFMAEGILRMAHHAFNDKVTRIMQLANVKMDEESKDAYVDFQNVVHGFYAHVDDTFQVEMSVFSDLYNTLEEVYGQVDRAGDEVLKDQTVGYLEEIYEVLNGRIKPDTELAEEVADWLADLLETNLGTKDWSISNSRHISVNGDHPDMAVKARQSYSPAGDLAVDAWGGKGGAMIGQDSMDYKGGGHAAEARNKSWGNVGGDKVYPGVSNPYVPSPFGDYTMKGEPGVDKNTFGQHHGSWQSSDTWPVLNNPYVPKAIGADGWRMKSDNLVIDK